jgi:hypothetical protein
MSRINNTGTRIAQLLGATTCAFVPTAAASSSASAQLMADLTGSAAAPAHQQAPAARGAPLSLAEFRARCARWARIVPAALVAALPAPARAEVAACAAADRREERPVATILGVMGLDSTDFERLTGAAVAQLHTYVTKREGWEPIRGRSAGARLHEVKAALEDEPGQTVLISYPPFPQGTEGNNGRRALGKCAAGNFNRYYLEYGRSLAAHGLNRLILRIGWEWDADYFVWGADRDLYQARLYGDCFAHVVRAIRRGHPDGRLLFDWGSTMRVTPEMLKAGYPGDGVVDVVSVSGYDNRGGSTPQERWARVERVFDLVRDFGRAHGKKLAFPEWGIWFNGGSWGGGDNPYHIQKVCAYAKNPANNVLYLNYFNRVNPYVDHRLEAHPRALAAFRAHCRGFAATAGEAFWPAPRARPSQRCG